MAAGFVLLLLVITTATSRSHGDTDLKRLNKLTGRYDRDTETSVSDGLVAIGRQLLEKMGSLADTLTDRVDRLTELVETQANQTKQMNETLTQRVERLVDDQKELEEDVKQCSDAKKALVRDMTDLSNKLTAAERQLSTTQSKISKDIMDMTSRQTNLSVDMTRLSSKLEDSVYQMSGAGHCGYCQADLKAGDCHDVKRYDARSGIKIVNIAGRDVSVYCDQTTDGGGWTVIQRRLDGSVDFYRGWVEYENGFGEKDGEYWLGLRNIYRMTSSANYTLRVDLEDFSGNTAYAQYSHFSVSGPETNYTLSVSGYSGTAGDTGGGGLSFDNNMQFTTKDRDHDHHSVINCASTAYFQGAWWYSICGNTNLNGPYRAPGTHSNENYDRILWYAWKQWESLKRTEMKIRPV